MNLLANEEKETRSMKSDRLLRAEENIAYENRQILNLLLR